MGADLVTRTIYQGCRALPFALAGLSCILSVLVTNKRTYKCRLTKIVGLDIGELWLSRVFCDRLSLSAVGLDKRKIVHRLLFIPVFFSA